MEFAAVGLCEVKYLRLDQTIRNLTWGNLEISLMVVLLGVTGLKKTWFVFLLDLFGEGGEGMVWSSVWGKPLVLKAPQGLDKSLEKVSCSLFRTQLNICDGTFLPNVVKRWNPEKFHHKYLTGLQIRLRYSVSYPVYEDTLVTN